MTKNRLGIEKPEEVLPLQMRQALSDTQALRLVMSAIIYGEIRHEHHLQQNLKELDPETIYAAVFKAVDGLLRESLK